MLTEHDRMELEKQTNQKRIDFLENVIKESARYERLMVNKDFQDVLKDLEDVLDVHNEQILITAKSKYRTDNLTERAQADIALEEHCIRVDQIEEFVNRPEKIISLAQSAREELARLKEKKHA